MSQTEYRTLMASSYSSGTLGRAICNSRNHHFIADEFDGDEVTAGEYFLTGLTACAVNMIERIASESRIPLQRLEVKADGSYKRNQGTEARTLFSAVNMCFQFAGVNTVEAKTLVAAYHRRCPLYGTVAAAITDVSTTIVTHLD